MNSKSIVAALLILVMSLLTVGCINGYKEFYHPSQGINSAQIEARRAAPAPKNPIIEHSRPTNGQDIVEAYAKRGYIMIGSSEFNSGTIESDDSAVSHAIDIGADLVLIINPQYTGTVTSSVPITTPKTTTSYSSGSATAYSSSGQSATAYGSSVTTTYGTKTDYIPVAIHRTNYGAMYFVKQRFTLGLFTRELDNSERQLIQSNKGAVVTLVVDGTPAFHADILPNDIIVEIDGVVITNPQTFSEIMSSKSGKKISISIMRGGKKIDKLIQLNS